MARLLSALTARDVGELSGVGAKAKEALGVLGVDNILDLLTFYPRRYIDRSQQIQIADLLPGSEAMVLARVEKVASRRTRNGRSMVDVKISDDSGSLTVTFFNQAWRTRQLVSGREAVFFGKVDSYRNKLQMTNPLVDLIGNRTGKIVPIYPQSSKANINSENIFLFASEAAQRAGEFAEPLTEAVRDELDLMPRTWAFNNVHAPESIGAAYAARKRLAFDELLRLQTILALRKRAFEREAGGISHVVDSPLVKGFLHGLSFDLTNAQLRTINEIQADMATSIPMHRLLQGDVGSGKTVVAVAMLLTAVEGGHQGALMAPTEVLAEQHFVSVRRMCEGLTVDEPGSLLQSRPVAVALLTGRATAAERKKVLAGLANGTIDVLVGTHALLTEGVAFNSLGAVVIDEQHRFGVEQRSALREKGTSGIPDVLVMTATPIPRTAAMTIYGDLDVSSLDEMPRGRMPIETSRAVVPDEINNAWAAVRAAVGRGEQAYVVCPLVSESDRVQAKSAVAEFERLCAQDLAGLRLGLMHGQMPAIEREAAMEAFRNHETDVLVATTVVEVGVDVPNATVMVIEDAARFGIAQLHQLRGRVGRGDKASRCFLLGEPETDDGNERLEALVGSTDGFELAEVDLELRGSGSIMGTRQKGRTDLKLASLRRNGREMIKAARKTAFDIVDADPTLAGNPTLLDDISELVDEEEREFLFKS